MRNRALAGVRARLDVVEAQLSTADPPLAPQAIYDRIESLAIAILDSEYMDFGEGELEEYLLTLLHQRAMELGICQFPDQKWQA